MILLDARGLTTTTDVPHVIESINAFVEALLSYGTEGTKIFPGVEAEPTSVMANTHGAAYWLFLESPEGFCQAQPYLEQAACNLDKANEREKLYFQAIQSWYDGDINKAIQYHETIAQQYPRDIASAKICHYHYFNLGNSEGMLEIAQKVFSTNTDLSYMYSMLAFALEQCGYVPEAEDAARQAIAMNRGDAAAHHALAHVFDTQGRLKEGIEFMESHADTWETLCSFIYTHNWWHTALYYLDLEQHDQVIEIYDQHLWKRWKTYSQDLAGAISTLWRLELRGVNMGERWYELASYAAERTQEQCLPFLDLHYIYALTRMGWQKKVNQMLDNMSAHAAKVKPETRQIWSEITIPAARGLIAYGQQDYHTAWKELEPIQHRMQMIGGSHAQRDVFKQTYREVLIKSNPSSIKKQANGLNLSRQAIDE